MAMARRMAREWQYRPELSQLPPYPRPYWPDMARKIAMIWPDKIVAPSGTQRFCRRGATIPRQPFGDAPTFHESHRAVIASRFAPAVPATAGTQAVSSTATRGRAGRAELSAKRCARRYQSIRVRAKFRRSPCPAKARWHQSPPRRDLQVSRIHRRFQHAAEQWPRRPHAGADEHRDAIEQLQRPVQDQE